MSYFDSQPSHDPHDFSQSSAQDNNGSVFVTPAELANDNSLHQFHGTQDSETQYALSPDSQYFIAQSNPPDIFRGAGEGFSLSTSHPSSISSHPRFSQTGSNSGIELFPRSIGGFVHQVDSPSGSTWITENRTQWGALPSVSLSLEPHVRTLVAAANESHCPPTVIVLQNGGVELTFNAYNDFLRNQPSAFPTEFEVFPETNVPADTSSIIEAFQSYQEIQLRRSPDAETSEPNTSVPRYKCTLGYGCVQSFKKKRDWKRHEHTHFPQKIWVCSHEPCNSRPTKQKTFLRRELFKQHHHDVHENQSTLSTQAADTYILVVVGSKWPRPCPFLGCRKSNFSVFDDRLEHIAKEHFEKRHELSVDNGISRSNGDEDQNGSSGGSTSRSWNTDSSHGSHHQNWGTSGGSSSGGASSLHFLGPNGAYSVREHSATTNQKPRHSPTGLDERLVLTETLVQLSLAEPHTTCTNDAIHPANPAERGKETANENVQDKDSEEKPDKCEHMIDNPETKGLAFEQKPDSIILPKSPWQATRLPSNISIVTVRERDLEATNRNSIDSMVPGITETQAPTAQTFVSRSLKSSVKHFFPGSKNKRTTDLEKYSKRSLELSPSPPAPPIARWLGERFDQQFWMPIILRYPLPTPFKKALSGKRPPNSSLEELEKMV